MKAVRLRWFVPVFLVMSMGLPPAASSQTRDRNRDSAIASEIRKLRQEIHEPVELAAQPWAPFAIQEAVNYCDPGFWVSLERWGRDCGLEANKFRLAVKLLVEAALSHVLEEFMGPMDPRLAALSERLALPPNEAAKTIEALATVVGVPVASCSCLAKGFLRAFMGEGPATEEQLKKIDGLTDLFQLTGLLEAAHSVWLNPSRFSELVKDAFADDYAGAIDTGLGPTQAAGWFDRIHGAWTSTDSAKWSDAMYSADQARTAFDACQVEGALAAQEQVLSKLLVWSDYRRRWIRHAENQRFCNERWTLTLEDWSLSLGVPVGLLASMPLMKDPAEGIGESLEYLIEDYRDDLSQIKALAILDPAWAKPASIAAKRSELDEIIRQLDEVSNLTKTGAESCDVGPALSTILAIDQNSACFAVAAGAGASNELKVQLEKLRELQLAQRALRPTLEPPLRDGLERLAACDLETWNEPMQEAIASFDRLYPNYHVGSLRSCWDGDWPPEALAKEKSLREEELAVATARARAGLERALGLIDACLFDQVEPLLFGATNDINTTRCGVSTDSCSNEQFNPVICSLQLLQQQIADAQGGLVSKRETFTQGANELVRIGGALVAWADEQQALLDGTGRCSALRDLPAIISDLENLKVPAGCEESSIEQLSLYRKRAAELRLIVQRYQDQEKREIEAVVGSAYRSYSGCDSEGLALASDELETLEAASCQASNRGPEVAAWQRQLDDAAATAERIEVESNAKLAAWEDYCDESGIAVFAAGLSNLPMCGWKSWDEYRRGELIARMAEVEAIRTVKIPALHELQRRLQARRLVGEAYLRSVDEVVARGLDVCKEIQGLKRLVADANAWLAEELSRDQSLPLICFADSLGEINYLENDLRGKLAAIDMDCPADEGNRSDNGDEEAAWSGKKVDDGFAGKRLEEPDSNPADRVGSNWCDGPRPAHEAALQRLVNATEPYNRDGILSAIAALTPARCPGDQEMLDRLRGPTIAAAQAESDVNTQKMADSSAWARGRAREQAAAISTLVGIAQQELDRYQRSRSGSTGGDSTYSGGADGDGAAEEEYQEGWTDSGSSSSGGQQCLVDPSIGEFGGPSDRTSFYVEESHRTAVGRTFRAYKIYRAGPDHISALRSGGNTFYGGFSSLNAAQQKLDQLCPPAQRGTGSVRFN